MKIKTATKELTQVAIVLLIDERLKYLYQ